MLTDQRACDRCHRSGVKVSSFIIEEGMLRKRTDDEQCSAGPDINTCAPCATYQTPCTYNRPVKRRGVSLGRDHLFMVPADSLACTQTDVRPAS